MSDQTNTPPFPTEPVSVLENVMNRLSFMKMTGEDEKLKQALLGKFIQKVQGEDDLYVIQRLPIKGEDEDMTEYIRRIGNVPVIANLLDFLGIKAVNINTIKHRDTIIGQTQSINDQVYFYNIEEVKTAIRLLELSEEAILNENIFLLKRPLQREPEWKAADEQ